MMSTNDPQQQSMIREAMKAIAERRPGRTKLVYDKTKRTIVAVAQGMQVAKALDITAEDADMFAVVSLSAMWLREHWAHVSHKGLPLKLSSWDGGDAYTQHGLGALPSEAFTDGVVFLDRSSGSGNERPINVSLTKTDEAQALRNSTFTAPDGARYVAKAWRREEGREQAVDVHIIDTRFALEERRKGLLESDVLAESTVLCIGLGTGGAHVAIELAKCGVGRFVLVDPDRLSAGNVVRHPGGLSQLGRTKVNVVRDLLFEKNPDISVSTHAVAVNTDNMTMMGDLFRAADVVISGTDNRPSKLIINKLSIDANVVTLYGGAFRRAYGGQVLRVRPRTSPCHQCFISEMPEEANDVEVASEAVAEEIAYSDRPVAVEPGLSLDVLPIANMLAKLALLELLKNKPSSLNLLQKDFDAPWYLWLNRPEPGTKYSSWPALSESMDEMTIHRWYGVYFDRDGGCPACGDFIKATGVAHGIDTESLASVPSMPSPI